MSGRKVEETAFTDVLFDNKINCDIVKDKLFLKGIYRDIKYLSAITEAGTALTEITDYDDDNDYYFDRNLGILTRNGTWWSTERFAIKMSGKLGLGTFDGVDSITPLDDIKQALIEIVAAKSSLWKVQVITEDGTVTTIRNMVKEETLKQIKKYLNVVI